MKGSVELTEMNGSQDTTTFDLTEPIGNTIWGLTALRKFYKNFLGVRHPKVLCDESFLRWIILKRRDSIRLEMSSLLRDNKVELVTTRCTLKDLNVWFASGGQNKDGKTKLAPADLAKVQFPSVCAHNLRDDADAMACIEQLVTQNRYYLATNGSKYKKKANTVLAPLVIVREGKLFLVPPTQLQKDWFEQNRAKRLGEQRSSDGGLKGAEMIVEESQVQVNKRKRPCLPFKPFFVLKKGVLKNKNVFKKRRHLSNLINTQPDVPEVVNYQRRPAKEKPRKDNSSEASTSKSPGSLKRSSDGGLKGAEKIVEESQVQNEEGKCGRCFGSYSGNEFWIACGVCMALFHGMCVEVTPTMAESIDENECPFCYVKRIKSVSSGTDRT